jgi:transcription termination factor Rho
MAGNSRGGALIIWLNCNMVWSRKRTVINEEEGKPKGRRVGVKKIDNTPKIEEIIKTEVEEIKPVLTGGESSEGKKEELGGSNGKIEGEKEVRMEELVAKPLVAQRSRVQMVNNRSRVELPKKVMPVVPMVAPAPVITGEPIVGVLEIMQDGSGYVRPKFNPSGRDAYINATYIRKIGLRAGDMVSGVARPPKESEKYWLLVRVDKVNGVEARLVTKREDFKDLVPVYAHNQVRLETEPELLSARIIDLFCPIGFGQRGMIVSPPKAGKTTLLKEIAAGVARNHPEVHLMAVLVGERPEEVTDMQRFIKGEVIASSFDQKPEEQTRAAEIAIERAKRLVEMGKDVFMVFDSITRLARAYNLAIPTSGRTLSGGFDPAALYPSKKFFGAARKIENGGSLTIIGTALVDTGSKMDDLIFEEFKGTGNMELRLDRALAERRIFPAFDILKSGTRKEELLLKPEVLEKILGLRRIFDTIGEKSEATAMVIEQMMKTKSNEEFLAKVGKK